MELYRVDYTLSGLTAKNCMKLLPTDGMKGTQKIVIGDQEGILQVFFMKKGELQVIFKQLPNNPISNVVLGGSLGTVQDKIFISSYNVVRGYTKKGKLFLNFETQLLEPIKSIFVSGNDLMVTGVHNYHHYHDCKLMDTYTCRDVINDIIALNVVKVRRLTAILACADHVLRTLDGSTVTQSLKLPNSPTTLYLLNGDGGTTGDHVLVGMQEGQIYLVQITRSSSTLIKWILESEAHKSEVTCITMFDLLKSGMSDIIIGRHDGNVEVYAIIPPDEVTNEFKPPIEKFSYACSESITAVQGGYVGNSNFEELVVTTHAGWLFGMTTEVPDRQLTSDADEFSNEYSREDQQKIMNLRTEVEELEFKLKKEREKYLLFTEEDSAGVLRLPFVTIKDKVILQKDDAFHTIIFESEINIETILIQCDVPITILDSEKNMSVSSSSKYVPNSGNHVLMTHRCQLNTVRFELKYIVDEGIKGALQVYIIPCTDPKFCQLKKFDIKPLSLHTRIHDSDQNRSYNELHLKGTFSIAEMHSWITQCLPGLPEKPPDEEKINYTFRSTLVDTILDCTYWRGEAIFKTDNISTMAILKDLLSKEATNKKIKLDISTTIIENSIISTIRFLHEKLEKYFNLEKQKVILEALKDIESAETESYENSLIPEYQSILRDETEILSQLKQRPFYLERLQRAVINLFTDWHKFKGVNVKPKLTSFSNTLKNNYNYDNIIAYFPL